MQPQNVPHISVWQATTQQQNGYASLDATSTHKKRNDRPHKLDYNTSTGIFLGFNGTAKNVYYYDIESRCVKTSTHGIYNEANITVPAMDRSSTSQTLIELGYTQQDVKQTDIIKHNPYSIRSTLIPTGKDTHARNTNGSRIWLIQHPHMSTTTKYNKQNTSWHITNTLIRHLCPTILQKQISK